MNNARRIEKAQIGFNSVMDLAQDAIMSRLNCHNIGRILEFDPTTQTATIELMQVKQFNNNLYNPAPLVGVPLIIYGAGGGHITLPDPTGTICLLLFLDRNIDSFLETGEPYVPETSRMHDFTDCVALTTFKTLANPLAEYDEKAVSIMNEEEVTPSQPSPSREGVNKSFVKVYGNKVLLKTNISGEEPTGAQIEISDKINIQNTVQSLAPLIQAFITACENITTVADESGGGLSPASKQAFADLKGKFEELLK